MVEIKPLEDVLGFLVNLESVNVASKDPPRTGDRFLNFSKEADTEGSGRFILLLRLALDLINAAGGVSLERGISRGGGGSSPPSANSFFLQALRLAYQEHFFLPFSFAASETGFVADYPARVSVLFHR